MTKLCIDYPMKYTHLLKGDITFALAQLYERFPAYEKTMIRLREEGREIMLDNGAWEFKVSMPVEDYLEIIQLLEPTYAVIPDAYQDAKKSRKLTLEFFDKFIPLNLDTKLIYAPQGKNITEIIEEYNFNVNKFFAYMDMVGIPKHVGDLLNRVAFTDMLYDSADIKFQKVHFLGYWNYEELMFAPKERKSAAWYLHSIDTKYPVKYAYLPTKFKDQLDYYLTDDKLNIDSFEVAVEHFYEGLLKLKWLKK